MRLKYKASLLLIYYTVYAFVYAGWLLHSSLSPAVFCYSATYFIFLIAMLFPFFLPVIIMLSVSRIGRKKFFFSIIPSLALASILYFLFSAHYYYTQKHLFDPFLQNPFDRLVRRSKIKNDNTFRIICLGGSTTKNLGLPFESRYPSVLNTILQNYYPSVNVEVLNAGATWYSTKHSLISYVTYWEEWNPDLIIVMHAINDLSRSFSPPDYAVGEYNDLWTHFYGPAINGARPPTFEQHLLRRLSTPINAWYAKFRFKEVDYPPERYISLGSFERNLKKIVKYAKTNRSGVILVTQPSLYKKKAEESELKRLYFGMTIANVQRNFFQREYPSSKSFYHAMKMFNEITKNVALSEGVVLSGADRVIEKDLRNFRDDVHYTEAGAEALAETVAETIIKNGLISP